MNAQGPEVGKVFQDYVKERCLYLEICRRNRLAPMDIAHLLKVDSALPLDDRLRIVRSIYRLRELEGSLAELLEEKPFTAAAESLDREKLH